MLSVRTIASLITRIQNDFLESPSLTMTLEEAQRRFGLDRTTCAAMLDVLVDATVLARTREGAFARLLPRARSRVSHAA